MGAFRIRGRDASIVSFAGGGSKCSGEYIQKPAYTDVKGHYPTNGQEMMVLPVDVQRK